MHVWEAGLRNKLFISRTTDPVYFALTLSCSMLAPPHPRRFPALCDKARVQIRSDSVTLKRARVRGTHRLCTMADIWQLKPWIAAVAINYGPSTRRPARLADVPLVAPPAWV